MRKWLSAMFRFFSDAIGGTLSYQLFFEIVSFALVNLKTLSKIILNSSLHR